MTNIRRPTLIVNESIARKNIEKMVGKCRRSGSVFRPHFKTHHSATVGNWFRDYNVKKITVSSVSMAYYFAQNGWDDITIAFPYNPLESHEIDQLAKKVKLNVLIESVDALIHLQSNVKSNVNYFLKIDVGYHRTGISPDDTEQIIKLIKLADSKVQFLGIIAHAGHSYKCRSHDEIKVVFEESKRLLLLTKNLMDASKIASFGDTPCCSVIDDLKGIDEIRCGNFVYFDLMQTEIFSCKREDIAVSVACPVVAVHPKRNQAIVYGGGVHFSKDSMMKNGQTIFGEGINYVENGWELATDIKLISISQEHGVVQFPENTIQQLKIGDILGFLPVHACLTAHCLNDQQTIYGEKLLKMNA